MNEVKNQPPRIGNWFLHLIYGPDRFDEISGDLLEIYHNRLEKEGKVRASIRYLVDVIFSFRNVGLAKKTTHFKSSRLILFRNNLSFTLRIIFKNRTYAGLNILGLALGMAAFLFILQYVSYEKSYDKFHTNYKNICRIHYMAYDASGALTKNLAVTAPRLATYMKEKMPEVEAFARVLPLSGLVYSYGNKKFREDGTKMVDADLLKIFDFPLLEGNPKTALRDLHSLVISKRMAKKYFGNEPALGKVMSIDGITAYTVTGVAKDVPENSHFHFDFLQSYATLRYWRGEGETETSWDEYNYYSYILLGPGQNTKTFEEKFERIFGADVQGKHNRELGIKERFLLQPIGDIHLYSHLNKEFENEEQGDSNAVFFLTIIALFILMIAWINYINLSTARAIERAKEVGVRKTIGAYRMQLIQQFMVESLFMNFTALIFALVIVITGIHYFNQLTNSKLDLNFLTDQFFWIKIILVFGAGSLLSGLYPAVVLSSFRPILVLKGKGGPQAFGTLLRRILVVFQFAASITLIAGTIVVYRQLNYMGSTDLGFEVTRTIILRGPNPIDDEAIKPAFMAINSSFKNELLKLSGVKIVATSSEIPGSEIRYWLAVKKLEAPREDSKLIFIQDIDYNFFSAYQIKLLAGRNFSPEFSDTSTVILNATASRLIGFDSPEEAFGRRVILGNWPCTIVGIVKDYNQLSVKKAMTPLIMWLNKAEYQNYTVKIDGGHYQTLLTSIQKIYEASWPKATFEYFFLDEFYNRQYTNEERFSRVFTLFAGFAIFVACLGLFGLSSFNASQKTKEIGIRKILGADVSNIVYMLSKEFFILVLVADVIAIPIIYSIMSRWLDNFAGRISIGVSVFLISGLSVLLMALVTVSYKTILTARSNPVTALRYE